jgi:hypothetical protein
LLTDWLDTASVIHTSPTMSNTNAEIERYTVRDIVHLRFYSSFVTEFLKKS